MQNILKHCVLIRGCLLKFTQLNIYIDTIYNFKFNISDFSPPVAPTALIEPRGGGGGISVAPPRFFSFLFPWLYYLIYKLIDLSLSLFLIMLNLISSHNWTYGFEISNNISPPTYPYPHPIHLPIFWIRSIFNSILY